jgi:photosystem II stability/assembly factor-like uncharacterized protein
MKKNILAAIFILQAALSMAQWTQQNVEFGDRYNHVVFVSDKVAFIDGPGKILKTTDAGTTWEDVYMGMDVSIVDFSFLSEQIGFISAERMGMPFISSTVDGGRTWKEMELMMDAGKMIFTSPEIGHMASGHGMIHRTTDGGEMWMDAGEHGNVSTGDFCFLDKNTGYFAGWYNGSIIKTTDEGATWESLHITGDFLDIYFPSANVGYTAGLFGSVTRTEDAGVTWKKLETGLPVDINLFSIHCTDDKTCYAVGDLGTIVRTTDAGEHWSLMESGTKQKLNAIACKGGNCFIVGDSGVVLKSTEVVLSDPKNEKLKPQLLMYPNPSADQVTLQYSTAAINNAYVLVYDAEGRLLDKLAFSKERVVLDGKKLGAGIYSCSLYVNNEFQGTQKLVIYQ